MDYSQLQKSSVRCLLQVEGIQDAEGCVQSVRFQEEMFLIGFVPYTVFEKHLFELDPIVDLNDHLVVTPYLLKSSKASLPVPIFHKISKAVGKKYKLDRNLIIEPMLDNVCKKADYIRERIRRPFNGEQLLSQKYKGHVSEDFFEKDDDQYLYVGKEGDLELSEGVGDMVCISNDFLCLCAYMNKVTGLPSYAILHSEDTIRVMSEEE
ncbi:MAG: hypothetical protein IK131_12590 [Paludibacteraceae bacterium]|nr:hypothetical protein [Paludibacteraceae bacterium]